MNLEGMGTTRQRGERRCVEMLAAVTRQVVAKRDPHTVIEIAVGAATKSSDRTKDKLRGYCRRVAHPRVAPLFATVMRAAERIKPHSNLHAVEHIVLQICKGIITAHPTPWRRPCVTSCAITLYEDGIPALAGRTPAPRGAAGAASMDDSTSATKLNSTRTCVAAARHRHRRGE